MADIVASTGNPSDVQSAINQAISGGGSSFNVGVPDGEWIWDYKSGGAVAVNLESLPAGAWLNLLGLYSNLNKAITTPNGQTITGPSVVLRSSVVSANDGKSILGINGGTYGSGVETRSANRHIRVSGLTVLGNTNNDGSVSVPGNTGINIQFVDNFRIDHCAIDSNTSADINCSYSRGLVDHCNISQLYHRTIGGVWGYGIGIYGNFGFYSNGLGNPTWITDVKQLYGSYDWKGKSLSWMVPVNGDYAVKGTTTNISHTATPIYVEDCNFYMCRHPTSSSQYASYVLRHSKMYGGVGIQMVDAHGGGASVAANAYATRMCEIYENEIYGATATYGEGTYAIGLRGGAALIYNNRLYDTITGILLANENYTSAYPTYPEYINDVWIWDNINSNVGNPLSVSSGQGITQNINYFLKAPDTFTYTPYVYPHPLVGALPTQGTLSVDATIQNVSFNLQKMS